jgi:hypothetical protein
MFKMIKRLVPWAPQGTKPPMGLSFFPGGVRLRWCVRRWTGVSYDGVTDSFRPAVWGYFVNARVGMHGNYIVFGTGMIKPSGPVPDRYPLSQPDRRKLPILDALVRDGKTRVLEFPWPRRSRIFRRE